MEAASAIARTLRAPSPLSSYYSSFSGPHLPNPTQALCFSRPTSILSPMPATKFTPPPVHRCFSASDGAAIQEQELPIEFPPFPIVIDVQQISRILPHRFPFLLVDRVIEYRPGVSAVGIKNVAINENFLLGHFPDRPIMPGALMVEALAQVGGIVLLQPEVSGFPDKMFLVGMDNVRFRKPVTAGDTLVMRMTIVKLQNKFQVARMEGKAYVGGEVVCEGEFLIAAATK